MFIPGPGFADQGEAVARIAEALLQELAGVAGDEVGGSGGIAVMQDAGDGQWRAAFGAPQRGVEVVEGAVAFVERAAAVVARGGDGNAAGEEVGRRADGLGRGMRLPWAQWRQFGGEFDDGGGGRKAEGFHSMEDARYGGQNQGESCDGECGASGEGAHVSSWGRTPVLRPASTPAYLHSGWAAWEAAAGLGPAPQGFPS